MLTYRAWKVVIALRETFDTEVFCYIGKRVEFDNVLPSIDDIYTEFQNAFEIMGYNTDVIEEMIDSYVSCSDITGVQIEWEGKLDAISDRNIAEGNQVSPKAS